jgi:hypothetical protein
MGLSAKERKMLDALTKKAEEPDAPGVGKTLNVSIDLGDEKQVARAQKLGLLDVEDDDDDDSDDDDDDQTDETPRRRGYFKGP